MLGRQAEPDFALYHQVLNRARWSTLAANRRLLALMLRHLDPGDPLVVGLDETMERCSGRRIEAKEVYRDADSRFVKAMGLCWISLMRLVRILWAQRIWTLPFLTILASSARDHAARDRHHKTLTRWARQTLTCRCRWRVEVTFQAVRTHPGAETQRQWSRGILRGYTSHGHAGLTIRGPGPGP